MLSEIKKKTRKQTLDIRENRKIGDEFVENKNDRIVGM